MFPGDARLGGVVAINTGSGTEVVDDDIEIAIPVEVATSHAMGDAFRVEPPLGSAFGEFEFAQVSECHVGCVLCGEHSPGKEDFAVRHLFAFTLLFQLDDRIEVACVPFHAVCDQHILESVQIDIHENGTPTPIRRGDPGVIGELRKKAEPPVEKQGVAHGLRTVVIPSWNGLVLHPGDHLIFPCPMAGVQHVHHQEIIQAIPVNVSKIDSHGKHAGLSERQRRGFTKAPLTNIKPKAIDPVEIVADIHVRTTVTVYVPKHHRQAPLVQQARQGRAVCAHEPPTAGLVSFEAKFAKVAIQHIRQAVLLDATAFVQSETVLKF